MRGVALLPLVGAGVARRLRAPATPVLAAALVLGLVAAATTSGGAVDSAGPAVEATFLVIGVLAGLVAVGSGGALPADRASGVDGWVAASAATPLGLRSAPAASGAGLTLVAAGLGGLVAFLALAAVGRLPDAEVTRPVPIRGPLRLVAEGTSPDTVLAVPGSAGRDVTVILDGRTLFRTVDATGATSTAVRIDAGSGWTERALPTRGATRLVFPSGATVRLRAAHPDLAYVLREVVYVDGARSPALNLLLAALLLGLGLAVGAPLATLLSRFTSGPTAAFSAATLLGLGVVHGPMLALAADAEGASGGRAAAAVLRAAAFLAPDLSALSSLGDAARGRAIPVSAILRDLLPALAHATLTTTLLLVGRTRRGRP